MTNHVGGRPRDSKVEAEVLHATVTLLRDRGYASLRINDIAEASGAAKTTIYRRWPTLTHLVVAAMEHAIGDRSFHESGDIAADLDGLIETAFGAFTGEGASLIAVALDIHRQDDPDLRAGYRERIIDPVRQQAITIIDAAKERGALSGSTESEAVVDAVIGGLIYRRAVLAEDVSIEQAKTFWRRVIRVPLSEPQAASGAVR
ncbi:TetR/AcrR family transcriptional regulator [Microbacterium sp.]|uniref:TetR/AcrR family transcriptional regulator n=1 Tax=Microbacterium sp. TaxID=51671 RepID=UPI0039E433C7